MVEPGWVMGDDIARGFVDECPRCEGLTLAGGKCEDCGFDDEWDSVDPDAVYNSGKEEA